MNPSVVPLPTLSDCPSRWIGTVPRCALHAVGRRESELRIVTRDESAGASPSAVPNGSRPRPILSTTRSFRSPTLACSLASGVSSVVAAARRRPTWWRDLRTWIRVVDEIVRDHRHRPRMERSLASRSWRRGCRCGRCSKRTVPSFDFPRVVDRGRERNSGDSIAPMVDASGEFVTIGERYALQISSRTCSKTDTSSDTRNRSGIR